MPTRKIADLPAPCLDSEHNPPTHIALERGVYEHVCPACGEKRQFVVETPTMGGPHSGAVYL